MTVKRVYVDRAVWLREALDIDIPDSLTDSEHVTAHVLTAMESGAYAKCWEEELCPLERVGVEIVVRRE